MFKILVAPCADCYSLLKLNPKLQLVELENAGHCAHDECPERVNARTFRLHSQPSTGACHLELASLIKNIYKEGVIIDNL